MILSKALLLLAALSTSVSAATYTTFSSTQLQWVAQDGPFEHFDNGVQWFMKTDGDFGAWDASGNLLWHSNTGGRDCSNGLCYVVFGADGNLVLFEHEGSGVTAYWSTATNSYSGHPDSGKTLELNQYYPYMQVYGQQSYLEYCTNTNVNNGDFYYNPSFQPLAFPVPGGGIGKSAARSKNSPFLTLESGLLDAGPPWSPGTACPNP